AARVVVGPRVGRVLRQADAGVGRADHGQVGIGRDRNLGLGDARVERTHEPEQLGVTHHRLHVLGALLGVVAAVDGVVVADRLEREAFDRATGALDRVLDALQDGLALRPFGAGERQFHADVDLALNSPSRGPASPAGESYESGARHDGDRFQVPEWSHTVSPLRICWAPAAPSLFPRPLPGFRGESAPAGDAATRVADPIL